MIAIATMLATATLASAATAATLVHNGSFEIDANLKGTSNKIEFGKLAGSDKGWDTYASLPGWVAVGKKAVIDVHADKGAKEVDALFGEHYVELDRKDSKGIRQTLTLKVGSYQLSFYFSPLKDLEDNQGKDEDKAKKPGIGYSIADLSGTIRNASGAVGTWTEVTGIFNVVKDGDHDLEFASFAASDKYRGFIDNVSVTALEAKGPAVAPVPLPAAGLLLVGAIGGLVALARRRRAA
jgi:hypothetical protein